MDTADFDLAPPPLAPHGLALLEEVPPHAHGGKSVSLSRYYMSRGSDAPRRLSLGGSVAGSCVRVFPVVLRALGMV